MPGGVVDSGESLTAGLTREVLEETGCTVEPRALVGIDSRVDDTPALVHVFACDRRSGEPQPSAETPEVGWFAADRLADAPAGNGIVLAAYVREPYAVLTRTRL